MGTGTTANEPEIPVISEGEVAWSVSVPGTLAMRPVKVATPLTVRPAVTPVAEVSTDPFGPEAILSVMGMLGKLVAMLLLGSSTATVTCEPIEANSHKEVGCSMNTK